MLFSVFGSIITGLLVYWQSYGSASFVGLLVITGAIDDAAYRVMKQLRQTRRVSELEEKWLLEAEKWKSTGAKQCQNGSPNGALLVERGLTIETCRNELMKSL